ncbi:phospholipase D family protein [Luteimonas sp. SX5]|uniref:Phospholipase D family protein n=1 Tax=Luteimonas galliterrae TaxID=2940486 RepID=A0ABT0MEP7_9GAMM|nr:phospholipase D family protein [Luteimonas galliterrae]MCL1633350.1 phospholipase D family protein [Luteimonas galliterrae]
MTRVKRILAWGAFALSLMIVSGIFLADYLTPPATGTPSTALPLHPTQTVLDRELVPLLARHPGQTGALMLPDGLDAFAARAMSARRAGRSLDLQYYIWHDDLTGRLLGREAYLAAQRGVRVRMLIDDMNAEGLDSKLLALDQHENIEIRVYNPFRNRKGLWRLLELAQRVFSVNHRMHNKAWIADGRVAVVGGRNIGEEYFDAAVEMNFRDLDLLLFGPAVGEASEIFDRYWNSAAAVPLSALTRKYPRELKFLIDDARREAKGEHAQRYLQRVDASEKVRNYLSQTLQPFWSDRIHVVADPPLKWKDSDRKDWLAQRIHDELGDARRKALVISPYFVPGPTVTADFLRLSRDGVEVGVITNSLAANDVFAVHGGYSKYREDLLRGGVRLYELRAQARSGQAGSGASMFGSSGASLHTKAFVVDDERGFVGSFNLDPRSIDLNTEMGVIFEDAGLAVALRNEYLRLASPELSYWVFLNGEGDLRWLDRAHKPPMLLDREPDTSAAKRALTRAIGWLPIESQL